MDEKGITVEILISIEKQYGEKERIEFSTIGVFEEGEFNASKKVENEKDFNILLRLVQYVTEKKFVYHPMHQARTSQLGPEKIWNKHRRTIKFCVNKDCWKL